MNTLEPAARGEALTVGELLRRYYLSFPVLLWVLLWLSINTGPWVFRETPQSRLEWLHAIRAAFPILVLVMAGYHLLAARALHPPVKLPRVISLCAFYGVVGLAACLMWPASDQWPALLGPLYWAAAYLSVIVVLRAALQGPDGLRQITHLNRLAWLMAGAFFLGIVLVARGALIEGRGLEASGYEVTGRLPSVAGMPMARASGISRFAAVPGIVCFVLMLRRRGAERVLWGAGAAASAVFIYWMQSRGTMLGFSAALVFALLTAGHRTRHLGVLLLIMLAVLVVLNGIPDEVIAHVTRRESVRRLGLLTGRTRAWNKAIEVILQSPFWGWGFQADRLLIQEHVHNTILYVLMTAGLVGGGAFIVAVVLAWRICLRALNSGLVVGAGQETMLIQAGSLLAFFTVRGMSEVCGALFGVDYMVMAAALAYLGALERTMAGMTAETQPGNTA